MKRKLTIAFLAAICALSCVATLSACDLDIIGMLTHTHEWVEGETVEADCTQNGYTLYECACGKTKRENEVQALGHNEVLHRGKAATCTEGGFEDYVTCTRCAYTSYTEIPPLGHDEVEHAAKDQNCTEIWWDAYVTCTRCEYSTYEQKQPLGHDIHEYSAKSPSCSSVGWNAYESCSRGDYSTYVEIPALPHKTVKTHDGIRCKEVCEVCNEIVNVGSHTFTSGACAACGISYQTYVNSFNGDYGYNFLASMNNGANLQSFYNAIDVSVSAFHGNGATLTESDRVKVESNNTETWYYRFATLNFGQYGVTREEAISVWKTYRDDKPAYYWLSNNAVYNSSVFVLCAFDGYINGDERTRLNEELFGEAEKMISEAPLNGTAYELTRCFHDGIIKKVDYVYNQQGLPETADWAHSVRGVLEGRGAVCEGYARTFQMLLNANGVENVFVTGYSGEEEHAWNLVKLDNGGWYWYDLTWDDFPQSQSGIRYDYFCKTDKNFLDTHTAASSALGIKFLYGLPARATEDYGVNVKYSFGGVDFAYEESKRLFRANESNLFPRERKILPA